MKATWSRKMGNTTSNAAAPLPPAEEEPRDIENFLDVLLENFEAADALNLQILTDSKHDPKETLNLLGTRFDIVASSLEKAKLMSSRSLAIALLQHLPLMIRANVEQQMKDQDKARLKSKEPLTNREELMVLARQEEKAVLLLEAEYTLAGVTQRPRVGAVSAC